MGWFTEHRAAKIAEGVDLWVDAEGKPRTVERCRSKGCVGACLSSISPFCYPHTVVRILAENNIPQAHIEIVLQALEDLRSAP